MSTIGERVKEVRKKMGFSQKELANELGISQNHVSSIETDKEKPSSLLIKFLSIKYNVDEEWLRTGTGSQYIEIDIGTDKGTIAKFNEVKLGLECLLRKRNGDDLRNTEEAIAFLDVLLSAPKLKDESESEFIEAIRMIIDLLEKLVFHVSYKRPYKLTGLDLVSLKNDCYTYIDEIEKHIKHAINIYLIKYGEEMKFKM